LQKQSATDIMSRRTSRHAENYPALMEVKQATPKYMQLHTYRGSDAMSKDWSA